MIFPYAHDQHSSRKWPFATTLLVLANVVCFVWLQSAMASFEHEAKRLYRDVAAAAGQRVEPNWVCAPNAHAEHFVEAAEVSAKCAALNEHLASNPIRQLGYVPRDRNVVGLFTSMFLHGGWAHLLFNMWFLWLCAGNLEDRWGRLVFVPFHLVGGVVSALTHGFFLSDSAVPVVGASGAVAATMGAFVLVHARARIRFFYIFFVRFGTFTAPAWLMLPLWLAGEVFDALLFSSTSATAHWAHVGGFVYGLAIAVALRVTGLETRLDAAVEKDVTAEQDPAIAQAGALIDQGRSAEAIAILEPLATRGLNIDAALELLRAAKAGGDRASEGVAYARLIYLYSRAGSDDVASSLCLEAQEAGLAGRVPRAARMRAAEHLARAGDASGAALAYEGALAEGLVDGISVQVAVDRARTLIALRRFALAREVLLGAWASPYRTTETEHAIQELLPKTELTVQL